MTEEYLTTLNSLGPDVDVVIVKDVSHFLMLDKPQLFNQYLTGFLSKSAIQIQ